MGPKSIIWRGRTYSAAKEEIQVSSSMTLQVIVIVIKSLVPTMLVHTTLIWFLLSTLSWVKSLDKLHFHCFAQMPPKWQCLWRKTQVYEHLYGQNPNFGSKSIFWVKIEISGLTHLWMSSVGTLVLLTYSKIDPYIFEFEV